MATSFKVLLHRSREIRAVARNLHELTLRDVVELAAQKLHREKAAS